LSFIYTLVPRTRKAFSYFEEIRGTHPQLLGGGSSVSVGNTLKPFLVLRTRKAFTLLSKKEEEPRWGRNVKV
jgi:hypothetical protein